MAEERGCALSDLKVDDLKTINPLFEKDVELVGRNKHGITCSFFRMCDWNPHAYC
jgi:hypothetical protein